MKAEDQQRQMGLEMTELWSSVQTFQLVSPVHKDPGADDVDTWDTTEVKNHNQEPSIDPVSAGHFSWILPAFSGRKAVRNTTAARFDQRVYCAAHYTRCSRSNLNPLLSPTTVQVNHGSTPPPPATQRHLPPLLLHLHGLHPAAILAGLLLLATQQT